MTKIATAEQISKILFNIDPMGTCCNVNVGMENEYLHEANHITHFMYSGYEFHTAVKKAFQHSFASDDISQSDLAKICSEYKNLIK